MHRPIEKSTAVYMLLRLVALLFALVSFATLAQPQVPPPANRSAMPLVEPDPRVLVGELRKGGLILYFRHMATDFSQNDARSTHAEDCANQRNLTDRGRDDARRVGAAIKALGIPIARVQASPTCRTMETARLVFGRAEASIDVRSRSTDPNDADRFLPLKAIFEARLPAGGHLGIASHGNPFFAVAGVPYLAEGEMAIVRPLGGDFEIVGRVRVEQWDGMLEVAGAPR